MDSAISLAEVRGMVRRRWWIPVVTTALGAPVAVALALTLPPVYASTAKIVVEAQIIPETLAQSTVAQSASERIQFIQQRLMTRQNLLEIAEQNRVFPNHREMSPSDIVAHMNRATSIRGTSSTDRRNRTITGVDITFRSERPAIAAQVANEFVSRILAQNSQTRTDRAANTLAFFEQEARRLELQVSAQAADIERFKSTNQDSLPESLSARQGELASLRDRLFTIAGQIGALNDQRNTIEQTLAVGGAAITGSRTPQAVELEQLRSALVTQSAVLSDTHPTIRQLRSRIAALEEVMTAAPESGSENSPQAIQRAQLELQIQGVNRQIELLEEQKALSEIRIEELQASIARTPSVQIQLETLMRRYDALQTQLREAISKQSQAQLGERLEASQQAERFEVIEQAIPPENPVSPNRPVIMAMGVAGSGGLGLAIAALLELLNRSLRTQRDLERRLEIRPIATIPYVRTAAEMRARGRLRRAAVAAVLVGPASALAAVHLFVMPLPDAANRFADRSGMATVIETLSRRLGG